MSIVAEIIGKIAGMGASGIASNLATRCVPELGKNFRGIKAVVYGLGSAGLGFAAGTAAEKAMTSAVDEVVTSVKELKDWLKSGDKEDEEDDAEEEFVEEETKKPNETVIREDGIVELDYITYIKLLNTACKQIQLEKVETTFREDGIVEVDYDTYCKLVAAASKQLKAEREAAATEEVAE